MSKVLRAVGSVAGLVASVAAFIPGAQPIAAAAAAVSAVANVGAAVLAKPPPARGQVNAVQIGVAPTPYAIGRTYAPGVLEHDVGYGPTLDDVPNPYRLMVTVASLGPIEAVEQSLADFVPVDFSGDAATGWYAGFLYRSLQLGACPEPAALAPHWTGAPGWSAAHRLSGKAAIARSLKFDKKGKRFAAGVPQFGDVVRGVLVYDPRQDSSYPGGSGACRPLDEASYVGGAAAENPGCHALTYALGRYQNGRKVFGIGLGDPVHRFTGIVVADFVELANVCDANGWTVGGIIQEPGNRWQNLKDICAAGGAEPVIKGSLLGLRINAPRVSLGTITRSDLVGDEISVPSCQVWKERLNTLTPKYRSEAHKWEYVQSSKVTVASYLAEDGEEKLAERQINLCQDPDQAAQLVAYELYDRRERYPIELPCSHRLRRFPVGSRLTLAPDVAAELGLEETPELIILRRGLDAGTMATVLTCRTENEAKHAAALALAGAGPEVPLIVAPELKDAVAAANGSASRGAYTIRSSTPAYRLTSDDVSVGVVAFDGVLDDGRAMSFAAATLPATASTEYAVFFDLEAGTYELTNQGPSAQLQSARYVWIGDIATLNALGEAPPSETPPPGGGGYGPRNPIP